MWVAMLWQCARRCLIAVGEKDGGIALWNYVTRKKIGRWVSHRGRIEALCFLREGNLLAVGSLDTTITLWRTRDVPPPDGRPR